MSFLDKPKITDKIGELAAPQPAPTREGEGWRENYFARQKEKFIERPDHWRHRIYRNPFDRSVCPKRVRLRYLPPNTGDLKRLTGLSIGFVHGYCNAKTSERMTRRRYGKAGWLWT